MNKVGGISLAGKQERVHKYFITDKEDEEPLVLNVADEEAAAKLWAKQTGRSVKDAVVSRIGSQATTITRRETKPLQPSKDRESK